MTTVARTRAELAAALAAHPGRRALVPTMGALHEGHRSLLRAGRQLADTVVVSIFVNPLQFGPNEDLDRYPRPFEADLAMCGDEGVDIVFAPAPDVMYPGGPLVRLAAGPMGTVFEGATRPGHFDGVLTVVLKLFNLTRPDVAVFGEKDAQQLALVRRMISDLDVPVEIVAAPTVREPDGLALSSRNRYLSPEQRAIAPAIAAALAAGRRAAADGPVAVLEAGCAVLDAQPLLRVDYLALVDPATFTDVPSDYAGEAILVGAAYAGTTRLIDNAKVHLPGRSTAQIPAGAGQAPATPSTQLPDAATITSERA